MFSYGEQHYCVTAATSASRTSIFIQRIPQELCRDQRPLNKNCVSLPEAPFGKETFTLENEEQNVHRSPECSQSQCNQPISIEVVKMPHSALNQWIHGNAYVIDNGFEYVLLLLKKLTGWKTHLSMKITLESIDVYVLYFWIGQFWKNPIPHFLHSFSPEVDASMSPPTDPGSAGLSPHLLSY